MSNTLESYDSHDGIVVELPGFWFVPLEAEALAFFSIL